MSTEEQAIHDPDAEHVMFHRDRSAATMDVTQDRRPEERNVEITDIQTTVVGGNYRWVLVRVYTDAGVAGTGEAYWGDGVADAIEGMKPHLVGETPLDVDRLYEHLIQRTSGQGSLAGTTVTAISGIEIALHDLAGKLLGVPAYQLLGGKYRDEIRVYCDTHAGEHAEAGDTGRMDYDEVYTPEAYVDAAHEVVDDGFDAIKFDLDVPTEHVKDRANRHLRRPEVDRMVDIAGAVCEAVPADVDVAFDLHWVWSGDSARRLLDRLERFDVWWVEDPVPPENPDVMREVVRNTTTTVATGENRYRKHGERRLIQEQATDVIHPDVPKVGGMRETRKIADFADAFYIPIALHNVSSPVGTLAAAHVAAAVPNFLAIEYHARDVEWWADLVERPVIEDGYVTAPERPGIGFDLDLDVVAERAVAGETVFDEA